MRNALLLVGGALVISSCEFGEVAIPEGDPMLVVFGVMRPDIERQWILVEQTLTGTYNTNDSLPSVIPGDAPPLPVTNATVTVSNLSLPDDPCGTVTFTETPAVAGVRQSSGLYWGPTGCPTMRPGDSLALRVETADGQIVSGETEVVGADRTVLRVSGDSVVLPGPALTLNRDVDTLEAEVIATFGRSVQVEVATADSTDTLDPTFLMFLDSTAITIPGNLVNFLDVVFDDDDTTANDSPESIFTAGRHHTVTVGLMDDHFFDYMRTGNMRLSGRGFLNHLDGGMGVFGCVTAAANEVRVVGNIDDEREGEYRVYGSLGPDINVDITMELYVEAAGEDTTAMAAFVLGDWMLGAIDTSVRGFFNGSELTFTIYQQHDPVDNPQLLLTVLLVGDIGDGNSFTMDAYGATKLGTLTVSKN
jgi:hypothetical protein